MQDKLNMAIEFVKSGNKDKAFNLLSEIINQDPQNESAWSWLIVCVESPDKKRYCLEKILQINPNNVKARQALEKMKASQPSVDHTPTSHAGIDIKPKTKKCPYCAEEVQAEALVCRYCGRRFVTKTMDSVGKSLSVLSLIFAVSIFIFPILVPYCNATIGFVFGLLALLAGERKGGILGMVANVVMLLVGLVIALFYMM